MGLCLLRLGDRSRHLQHGLNLLASFLISILFAYTVNGDPKLLVGVATQTEAGFAVAVPGSSTFLPSCFLGLAT